MAVPNIVDIPHRLGKDEVRRRLQTRIGELGSHIPGGLAEVQSSWPGTYLMAVEVGALGQRISATLDIQETLVRVSFTLPPLLSFMAGAIGQSIQSKGGQLLLGPPSR